MSPDLSVVIPIKNEAANLEPLCVELREALGSCGRSYEILLVDDGSTDESLATMRRLQAGDSHLRVIQFERNFGQTAAFAAGFAYARGRLIATADGDLQNDPRDLPAMIDRLETGGFDLVCGWRRERKDARLSRELPSRIANGLISWATGVHLHDGGCSLKVFRGEVARRLKLYGQLHRFLPALASQQGIQIAEFVVHHRPRIHGESKYGIGRTPRVLVDILMLRCVLSGSLWPAATACLAGCAVAIGGCGAWVWLTQPAHVSPGWWSAPACLVPVLVGVGLGLLGNAAIREFSAYRSAGDHPVYAVRQIFETSPD